MAEEIDLTNANDCRKFLRSITMNGAAVKAFELSDGRKIPVGQMTDAEAVQLANDFYFNWLGGGADGGDVNTDLTALLKTKGVH